MSLKRRTCHQKQTNKQKTPLWHRGYFELVIFVLNSKHRRSSENQIQNTLLKMFTYIRANSISNSVSLSVPEKKDDSKSLESLIHRERKHLNVHNELTPFFFLLKFIWVTITSKVT